MGCLEMKPLTVKAENGFTLIEMALVTALVGIIVSGLLIGIPQYVQYRQTQTTRAHMDLAMNALSVYSQRYLRLPCPADTVDATLASGARVGRGTERDGGYCYKNITNRTLYGQAEGVLPWKALGLSERDAMDGWGRYITYKPAPHLTVQTSAPEMQTGANGQDIHNACRTRIWFDNAGLQHIDRQKALFCCNSAPKQTYLGSAIPSDYDSDISPSDAEDIAARLNAIVPAAGADSDIVKVNDDPVVSTNRWIDDYSARTSPAAGGDYFLAGSFSQPFNTDADAPLLRASGHAVTLISHGGNGIFSPLRKQTARLDSSTDAAGTPDSPDAASDERRNIWPPETFAASLFHPKTSNGGAYDKGSLIRGASDDVVAWARSDQLFARAGDATCTRPPVVLAQTTQSCSNYGNFIYVLDNSGSMKRRYEGYNSRITVAKNVLPEVIALHIREENKDSSPDEIGFTRLTLNPDGTLRILTAESVILNADYEIDSDANVDRAISAAQTDVANTRANGNTALFDTILQSAEIANDPARQDPDSDERTALLVVSDGYDNESNMGTNCREDSDYWCDESYAARQKAADKNLMLNTINARYFPLDIDAIKAQPDYDSMTREELFGQILRDHYPNMDLHIVDMSVTADNQSLSDLRAMVAKVGKGSTFNVAGDTESLRNALMSACRTVTTVSAQ